MLPIGEKMFFVQMLLIFSLLVQFLHCVPISQQKFPSTYITAAALTPTISTTSSHQHAMLQNSLTGCPSATIVARSSPPKPLLATTRDEIEEGSDVDANGSNNDSDDYEDDDQQQRQDNAEPSSSSNSTTLQPQHHQSTDLQTAQTSNRAQTKVAPTRSEPDVKVKVRISQQQQPETAASADIDDLINLDDKTYDVHLYDKAGLDWHLSPYHQTEAYYDAGNRFDDNYNHKQHQNFEHSAIIKSKRKKDSYMYAESAKKSHLRAGFKLGNSKHRISGRSEQAKSDANGHFKWKSKKGKGIHYWHFEHSPKSIKNYHY